MIFLYPLSIVYFQNPPAFKINPFKIHPIKFYIFVIYKFILWILRIFLFIIFFTITTNPNPYPWLLSGSQIWLSGFWTGGFWTRLDFDADGFWTCPVISTFLEIILAVYFIYKLKHIFNILQKKSEKNQN